MNYVKLCIGMSYVKLCRNTFFSMTHGVYYVMLCHALSYHIILFQLLYKDMLIGVCALVSDAASPVACPFQKAFHFTYNNQSGGFCRSPTSYAHQCSTGTMLRLYFRQCRHCMHTYDSGKINLAVLRLHLQL